MRKLKHFGLMFTVWLMVGADAMAQSRDWANPINEKINLLATGLQGFGVGLAVVGLIITAYTYMVHQQIDIRKLTAVLVGATVCTLGGELVRAFFG